MKTQAYRTKLSEIFPIFTPRVLVLSPPLLLLPPPPDMGSQSISCYLSTSLAAFLRVLPIPCLYPFFTLKAFPHQRTKLELSRQKDKFCQILKPSDSVSV